jgi:hypothetical protein
MTRDVEVSRRRCKQNTTVSLARLDGSAGFSDLDCFDDAGMSCIDGDIAGTGAFSCRDARRSRGFARDRGDRATGALIH